MGTILTNRPIGDFTMVLFKKVFSSISVVVMILSAVEMAGAGQSVQIKGIEAWGAADEWKTLLKNITGCVYSQTENFNKYTIDGKKGNWINLELTFGTSKSAAALSLVNTSQSLPDPVSYSFVGVGIHGFSKAPTNFVMFTLWDGKGGFSFMPIEKSSFCKVNFSLTGENLVGDFSCKGLTIFSPENKSDNNTEVISVASNSLFCTKKAEKSVKK